MSSGKWNRKFLQFWFNEWIDSAVRKELCIGGRGIFFELFALAGRSNYEGKICHSRDEGYPMEMIAHLVKADKKLVEKTLEVLSKPHGKERKPTITVDLYGVITFNNWDKYQPKSKWDDKKETPSALARSADAKETLRYYTKKINPGTQITEGNLKMVGKALVKYSTEQLKEMIDSRSADEWFMGPEGNAKRGAAWFFSSNDRLGRYLEMKPIKKKKGEPRDVCGKGKGKVL